MDMNTIVHVGDVVENEHQSVSQSVKLSRFFSRPVFPTILEPGTGLFRERLSQKMSARQSQNVK